MGGSGGHMRHPHDLDEVKTGADIIQLFRAIPGYLRTEEFSGGRTTSLKLDGSNNAIKVVRRGSNDIEFAVDRASQSSLDVNGVTLDKIKQRFTKVMKSGEVKFNAGLARSSAGLITMLDRTYRSNPKKVHPLLENLGLIGADGTPDPTKFINIEYIERKPEDIDQETGMGRANAIYYSFDSITFLNISQYYEVVRKGVTKRPGAKRPIVTGYNEQGEKVEKISTDVSFALNFNPQDLDTLSAMAQTYAPMNSADEQFTVLGPGDLGVRVDHDSPEGAPEEEIAMATEKAIAQLEGAIERTLDSNLTFVIDDQTSISKPLIEWLKIAINFPYKPDITMIDGSHKGPFTKELHNQLVDLQTPLSEIIPIDKKGCTFDGSLSDCEKAIYGAIFYEAARRLGNTVKQVLQSKYDKFGSTVDQEGVVINAGMPFGDKTTSSTFKLTGEFIVDGNQGVYAIREQVQDISQPFTIVISKDREITKTLKEWLAEAKDANHSYQKLPNMVYRDILAGVPIVGIVVQENAEKAIYNAVMGYVNGLQEDEGLDMEFIEDETDDPVVDVDFPKTYAIIPGAFKPPHAGHADMVRRYATGDGVPKADEVIVVISAPMDAQRQLRDGTPINEKHAIELWEKLFPEVAGLPNVEFQVAPAEMRSPITVAYEYISERSPLPLKVGDKVMLGASDKPDKNEDPDWMRWLSVDKEKHVKQGVELLAGEEYAVPAFGRPSGGSFSATVMRDLISDLVEDPNNKNALNDLKEFVPADKIDVLFSILDLPSPAAGIEEMAAQSAGAVGGYAVPLESTSAKTGRKKRKKTKQQEYIDLSLIDEVMKLIIERGIVQ